MTRSTSATEQGPAGSDTTATPGLTTTADPDVTVSGVGATPETDPVLAEPEVAASRLVAQRQPFSGPVPLVPDDMYARVTSGIVERTRSGARLHPNATLSTNAYFGRFPASHWQRWTAVTETQLTATVVGSGRLTIMASDSDSDPRPVAVLDVRGAAGETVVLPALLDMFVDGGALWLEVTTGDDALELTDVAWTVPAPADVRPTALVICTFNRVEDCLRTLGALAADPMPSTIIDAIYVVDQGSDPLSSRPRFDELAAEIGEQLHYIRQPNLGGAGGFTRGLFEVTEVQHEDHANVLFMDDDVICEPDIVVRLTAFANCTVEPLIVGGQMLYLLHPDKLHVGAEAADLAVLEPGKPVKHAVTASDIFDEDLPREQNHDVRVDPGYNGWWSCLIPSEIVAQIGYPLPMFFQWDDIEYAYRARAHGHATVTLPGAGVWHADFAWKDWDDWHRYFNLRNAMITSALHGPATSGLARVMFAQLTRYLVSMQYGLAATLIKAVEDFLQGPSILADGGQAAAKDIRTLRAAYPETVRHPASAVPGMTASTATIVDSAPAPRLKRAVLVKRFVDSLRGSHRFPIGAVRNADAHWWHVSLFAQVVVTDASQTGVRIRTYDRSTLIRLFRDGRRVMSRLKRDGDAVGQQWRDAMPELTDRATWARLYDTDAG